MSDKEILLSLLENEFNELRSRREPEYLFVSAAVAAFGAFAWGVAALARELPTIPLYQHPSLSGIVGVAILAILVTAKVWREHFKYREVWEGKKKLLDLIISNGWLHLNDVPEGIITPVGKGFLWSLGVLWAAAVGAIIFCLSVLAMYS